MLRYRFADFTLSPRRRVLVRGSRELPLIPRYFDLLLLLIEHRNEALHKRDIFDRVWRDVIVSDSALSQAVRTLRRTLGDDSRDPQFIRTVSRHGYRFVFPDVVEEPDDEAWLPKGSAAVLREDVADPFEPLVQRLLVRAASLEEEEEQRDAAERLHALGTARALECLGDRPGHVHARALLRDTRWDAAGAGAVPLLGQPGAVATAVTLVRLRLARTVRLAIGRAIGTALGGGAAGIVGGTLGGLLLVVAPGSRAHLEVVGVLALLGAACGALGGAGVGAGSASAEVVARSQRAAAVVTGAALGGGAAGSVAQWLGRWTLEALVGLHVPIGGGLEGIVLGGAAGLGYTLSTQRTDGGLAAPRGRDRLRAVLLTAATCALGALALTLGGRALVGGTVHAIAQAAAGSQATLTPLGRLIGEPEFGSVTRAVIGTGEGGLFGFGLALGLTHRPPPHPHLTH